MARSDLLINLVRAGVSGDAPMLRRTVEAIVAEERAKQHNVVADRLERVLATPNGNTTANVNRQGQEVALRARDFLAEVMPRRHLDDLVLPEVTQLSARPLIEEQ